MDISYLITEGYDVFSIIIPNKCLQNRHEYLSDINLVTYSCKD